MEFDLAGIVALCKQLILGLEVIAIPVAAIVINNSVQIDLGYEPSSDVVRNNCIIVGNRIVANDSPGGTPNLITPASQSTQDSDCQGPSAWCQVMSSLSSRLTEVCLQLHSIHINVHTWLVSTAGYILHEC